jgi:hypothetical protein
MLCLVSIAPIIFYSYHNIMQSKAVVLRGCFTSLKQNDLAIFTENVVKLTYGNKLYSSVSASAEDVKMKYEVYKDLLLTSLSIGASTEKKKIAYKNLLAALQKLADGLDYFSEGDVSYIENAGMVAQKERVNSRIKSTKPLSIPQITGVLVSNTVPGEIEVDLTKVEGASNYGFEYSENGENWVNGQYSSSSNAKIKLPSRKDLWLRARAIGTNDRSSDFCTPIKTFVL